MIVERSDNNNGNNVADTMIRKQNGVQCTMWIMNLIFILSKYNTWSVKDVPTNKNYLLLFRRESRNATNNLLNLTDFDVINTNVISDSAISPQILDLQVGKDNYGSKDLTGMNELCGVVWTFFEEAVAYENKKKVLLEAWC
jgi:hypothetical protein